MDFLSAKLEAKRACAGRPVGLGRMVWRRAFFVLGGSTLGVDKARMA